MQNELLKSNINIVKLINRSTDEIIPIIIATPELDEQLKGTIVNIFKFLSNLIDLMPEIIYSNSNQANNKYELLQSIDKICKSINNLPHNAENLSDVWLEYNFWWDNYIQLCDKLNVKNTISVSMN